MNQFIEFIQNLYRGRIGRKYYLLGILLIGLFFGGMSAMFGFDGYHYNFNIFSGLINVAGLVVGLSLHVRRFQDIGTSGWWALLTWIPMVNFFAILYLVFTKGEPGKNVYGDPLPGNTPFLNAVFNHKIQPVSNP